MSRRSPRCEPVPVEVRQTADLLERRWQLSIIYAALSGLTKADVLREFGGGQFSSFKNALVELCVTKLAPIAVEMKRLTADPGYVDAVLVDGANRARAIAADTMHATKDIVGFIH